MTTVLGNTLPVKGSETYRDVWTDYLDAILIALGDEAATKTVNLNGADKNFSRHNFLDCSETAYSLGSISGAVTIDYTNGHVQYGTVTGNITSLTINNPPATGYNGWLTLELTWGGAGYTIDLTSGTTYRSASGSIDYTTTSGAINEFFLRTRDAGTIWKVSTIDNIQAIS